MGMSQKSDTLVSVILPIRNAASFIEAFVHELIRVLEPRFKDYEVVLVDHGSTDDTVELSRKLQTSHRNIQLYCLSRPTNADVALVAGLDNAIGDFVITLDPRTDPPQLVRSMLDEAQRGVEIVYGLRADRQAGAIKRPYAMLARLFYRLFRRFTGLEIPPEASSKARLLSRSVVNYMLQRGDRHYLLRVMPALSGYRHGVVRYTPMLRGNASVKGSLGQELSYAFYILVTTSIIPLRTVTLLAIVAALLNLVYALYVLAVPIFKEEVAEGWMSLSLQNAGMFFLVCVILAIICEYLHKIFTESRGAPIYHISHESSSTVITQKDDLNILNGANNLQHVRPKDRRTSVS